MLCKEQTFLDAGFPPFCRWQGEEALTKLVALGRPFGTFHVRHTDPVLFRALFTWWWLSTVLNICSEMAFY